MPAPACVCGRQAAHQAKGAARPAEAHERAEIEVAQHNLAHVLRHGAPVGGIQQRRVRPAACSLRHALSLGKRAGFVDALKLASTLVARLPGPGPLPGTTHLGGGDHTHAMSALAALAAAEAALDVGALDDDSSGGTGEEHGGQARPAGFEDHGSELLARLEDALVAEARARPSACARALGKAAELAGEPAALAGGVHQREPGVWVEDALARSLSRLEDTLLLRARGAGDQQGGATNREAIARADQALRSADALPHRAGAAPLKTGVRAAQLKRPSSAPLVHPPASDGGSDLRIRQRAYDDQRAGRVRTPQHAVVRPAPKVFDANATCNHCFKPGRVRRDENGRLQPKLSSRLARMSVPTFMGLPLVWHPEAALRAVRR